MRCYQNIKIYSYTRPLKSLPVRQLQCKSTAKRFGACVKLLMFWWLQGWEILYLIFLNCAHSVASDYGFWHRPHGVVKIICDTPVIWWSRRAWPKWTKHLCTICNDSKRYVHSRWLWLSEMDPSSVHTRLDVTANDIIFESTCYDFISTKILCDSIRERVRTLPSLLFLIFLDFMDMSTISHSPCSPC